MYHVLPIWVINYGSFVQYTMHHLHVLCITLYVFCIMLTVRLGIMY
jgi:hypothetical protein